MDSWGQVVKDRRFCILMADLVSRGKNRPPEKKVDPPSKVDRTTFARLSPDFRPTVFGFRQIRRKHIRRRLVSKWQRNGFGRPCESPPPSPRAAQTRRKLSPLPLSPSAARPVRKLRLPPRRPLMAAPLQPRLLLPRLLMPLMLLRLLILLMLSMVVQLILPTMQPM